MGKKKVLFIWHAAVVKTYQQYVAELAEHDDLDITLLMPRGNTEGSLYVKAYVPPSAKYKVIVGRQYYPQDNLIGFYPALPFFFMKVKPDLIHLFEEPWHNIASWVVFWKKLLCPKAKFIFQTFQNQIENYRKVWIKTQNRTFAASDLALACAEEMKTVLEYWKYKKPIHVIYPGIETRLFYRRSATALRQRLGLNKFTIGFAGRMVKEKGVEDLLAASRQLNFPHQLLLIGNGSDKAYFKTLTNNAVWVDAVDPDEINQYYCAMDTLVLPSRTTKAWKEQFGRVLIEAMLCGVVPIGSSSGEISNVIGDAGLIFKEQDSQNLAEKITCLYQDSNLRHTLTQKGLQRGKLFDWKIIADQVYAVYRQLLYGN
jgi:glycosyltransferase involved in cell wall biosynthesis